MFKLIYDISEGVVFGLAVVSVLALVGVQIAADNPHTRYTLTAFLNPIAAGLLLSVLAMELARWLAQAIRAGLSAMVPRLLPESMVSPEDKEPPALVWGIGTYVAQAEARKREKALKGA